jgi:hypothetical protein
MLDEGKGKNVEVETKNEANVKTDQNTPLYPYWKKVPAQWNFPAGCASGLAKGGWAASVDRQKGTSDVL